MRVRVEGRRLRTSRAGGRERGAPCTPEASPGRTVRKVGAAACTERARVASRPDASENVRVMSSPACVAARLAKVRVVDAPKDVSVAGPRRLPWERTAVMLVATDADLSER